MPTLTLNDEVERIKRLPARVPRERTYRPPEIAGITLWPDQLDVLEDLHLGRGSIAAYGVGNGKTWITMLAGHAAGAKRPLVVVPSRLLRKTQVDFDAMLRALPVGFEPPVVVGYEWLRHPKQAEYLAKYQPDLVVCDEAHDLRNNTAQITQLIARYVFTSRARFVALSGTLITQKVADLHTVSLLAFGDDSPLPRKRALCERMDEFFGEGGGSRMCSAWVQPGDTPFAAYRRHVTTTEGFRYRPSQGCDASIEVSLHEWASSGLGDEVRGTGEFRGQELGEWDAKRTAVMLDWGYYHDHEPAPPREWWRARKAWFDVVARVMDEDREMLGPGHVVWSGLRTDADRAVREQWLAAKRVYPTVSVPTWVDHSRVAALAQWIRERSTQDAPLIVWYWHAELGRAVSAQLGVPCYGSQGDCVHGRGNLYERSSQAHLAFASAPALGTGSNLQAWRRTVLLEPYANPTGLEQLLGRHHRSGQLADTVEIDVVSCRPTLLHRLRGLARSEAKQRLGTKLALASFVVDNANVDW